MTSPQRLLERARRGPANMRFAALCQLVQAAGFSLRRIQGSHHIYTHPRIGRLVNLQNDRGKAKSYQVRQVVDLIDAYDLLSSDPHSEDDHA